MSEQAGKGPPRTANVGIEDVLAREETHLRSARAHPDAAVRADKPAVAAAATPVGLGLSGGGIRSATFSLGVLQALAFHGKLASFDYLSTVSGGGYIGSWLSAWIHRDGLKSVQDNLGAFGTQPGAGVPAADEPAQVTWLRRYSNYLTPRLGTFSLDSLTLIATWSRNFFLNLIVLLGVLGALFLVPYLAIEPFKTASDSPAVFGFAAAWVGLMFVGGIIYNLWHQTLPIGRRRNWLIRPAGVVTVVIVPGLITAWSATAWLFGAEERGGQNLSAVEYVGVLLGCLTALWIIAEAGKIIGERIRRAGAAANADDKQLPGWPAVRHLLYRLWIFLLAIVVGLAFGVLALIGMVHLFGHWHAADDPPVLLITLGPPAFLLAFGVASTVFIGMAGRVYYERAREWWSRLNAWFTTLAVIWVVWCAYAFYSLPTMEWLHSNLGFWVGLLGTGWIGALVASIFGRKPQSASERMQINVDLALNIAATVFVIGFLFCVAAGVTRGLFATPTIPNSSEAAHVQSIASDSKTGQGGASQPSPEAAADKDRCVEKICAALACALKGCANSEGAAVESTKPAPAKAQPFAKFWKQQAERIMALRKRDIYAVPVALADFLALAALALLFGWRVDINKFSLHNMYKNRLVRCYLGASNQKNRNEQPFVGLDDGDDLKLAVLTNPKDEQQGQRPFHIINTTLNISQGSNLAWQERKAASFVFTPLYCGYSMARTQGDTIEIDSPKAWQQLGYRRTEEYASDDREESGFTLGMALATSGAAVSPNMGHATQPSRAFVLTLFNVRLGRWSPNPLHDKYTKSSPGLGVIPLLQELLGYSNEERNFVYLSDGGHFDNLGLYELIRRRCKTIFIVDAGQDPDRQLDDLGEAIRKCRIDLGVEVRFDTLKQICSDEHDGKTSPPEKGYVMGTIHYDDDDIGKIVIIKPTMTSKRDEPVDVLNYASNNPMFPQETTADQFFSESQFESYRRLGLHIADKCVREYGPLLPHCDPPGRPTPPDPPDPLPTFPTRVLAWLLRWPAKTWPPREGSLVDFFMIGLALTVLGSLGFVLFDRFILQGPAGTFCFAFDACVKNVTDLLTAGSNAPFWRNAAAWRTMIDNFYVLAYTGTFWMAYVVGVSRTKTIDARMKPIALTVLCAVAALGAAADYGENFTMLAGIESVTDNATDSARIALATAPFTLAKFVLFTTNSVVLLLLLGNIWKAFKSRWSK